MSDGNRSIGVVGTWTLFCYTVGLVNASIEDNQSLVVVVGHIAVQGAVLALLWLGLWLVDTFEIRKRVRS